MQINRSIGRSDVNQMTFTDNKWTCSPKLSWLHRWHKTFKRALKNVDATRCSYSHQKSRNGLGPARGPPIFLVAEFYDVRVLPECPLVVNCSCAISHMQESLDIDDEDRIYTVEVDCREKGLRSFPMLPEHTRSVNLAGNKVSHNVTTVHSVTVMKVDVYFEGHFLRFRSHFVNDFCLLSSVFSLLSFAPIISLRLIKRGTSVFLLYCSGTRDASTTTTFLCIQNRDFSS